MISTDILDQFNYLKTKLPGEIVLAESFKKRISKIITFSVKACEYNFEEGMLDLNSVQCLILSLLYALSIDDVPSSLFLIKVSEKFKHLKSKYLTVWLLNDCKFDTETVEKCLQTLEKLMKLDLINPLPNDLINIFSALHEKYFHVSKKFSESYTHLQFQRNNIVTYYGTNEACEAPKDLLNDKLQEAVEKNNASEIILLAARGANINLRTCSGETLYHLAVAGSCAEAVSALASLKSDMEARDNEWETPLSKAVQSRKVNCVRALLSAGARVDQKFQGGNQILHIVASQNSKDALKVLLKFTSNVNVENINKQTPLILAVKYRNPKIVNLLLKNGANVNNTINGESLLHVACRLSSADIVKYLLKYGAKIESKNAEGLMPIHLSRNANVIEALFSCKVSLNLLTTSSDSTLHLALINKCDEVVKALIRCGATIDLQNGKGETPLLLAVKHKRYEMIRSLLYNGADPDMKDTAGLNAAILATSQNELEALQMLSGAGANLRIKSNDDFNLLHIAALHGQCDVIDFLLRSDRDFPLMEFCKFRDWKYCYNQSPHSTSCTCSISLPRFWTPFHLACFKGFEPIVLALLQANVPVDVVDSEKWTPLHLASERGNISLVRLLLRHGAKISQKNNIKQTVCHIAATKGHLELLKFLVEMNANINEVGFSGWTPLHYAVANGHLEVVRYLLDCGGNINASAQGYTPLSISSNSAAIASLLQSRGAR